jgi:hypothetical protein
MVSITLLAVGKLRPLNSMSCLALVSGRLRKAPREPGFPVFLRAYVIQQLVVAAAVLHEEQADVKPRLLAHAGLDQQPAQAAAMDERLQLRHAVLKVPRRRLHEVRIARSGGADPVLAAPELHLTWAPAADRHRDLGPAAGRGFREADGRRAASHRSVSPDHAPGRPLRSRPAPLSEAACATGLFLPAVEKSSEE